MSTFQELGLCSALVESAAMMGIHKPTDIQRRCIPAILNGKDIIGRAETGSGKTAAFAFPILELLSRDPFGIFAIVLTPARELAIQIAEQFTSIGTFCNLKCSVVIGGMFQIPQAVELTSRPHVIIATPGRLADHFRSCPNDLYLSNLQFLVLDEADRLLEPRFSDDIDVILSKLPAKRQTLLFSATITQHVREFCPNAASFTFESASKSEFSTCSNLTQQYVFFPQILKPCVLVKLLEEKSSVPNHLSIVFVSTCKTAEILSEMLTLMELSCVGLHSNLSQRRRLASLGKFRSGRANIMIATDVASRGLDIQHVQLVVNYDLPRNPADYVHRVGRTARAGQSGTAISVLTQYDIQLFKVIEKHIGLTLSEHELNGDEVASQFKVVNSKLRMARLRLDEYAMKMRKAGKSRKKIAG
ncbi:RNA helicase [Plasmodiophora brassicae]|uniref:RNA helicase n=1 Tax=Plasmodiophora brassicae TaxID=37360 RepID=A0A0G4J7Q4_PLABS|nr:hypothetical protein PBRA_003174 [Plasmodiophora brassicae]SPQ95647.1 unnamed protein product [Plasmodiophora brassicae]